MSKKSGKPAKDIEEQTYELREIVLAKLRGFPNWPAMVVDPSGVPEAVLKERPLGKSSGTSAKKTSTFYCVRFFPAGDFSWVSTPNLSKLKRHEIEAYIQEPQQKREDLLEGYKVALDPEEWEKKRIEEAAGAEDDEEEEAEDEVDELEGEEEAGDDEKKPKKRKRDSEPASKTKSKAKKEKASGGESLSKKKKSSEKAEKPAKSKKNGVKSKTLIESEDEGERAENAGPSKKASSPPAKKQKHSGKEEDGDPELAGDVGAGKVREWRHKLQRAFLSKTSPKEEDMVALDALFTEVEDFEMTIKYLQYSKIGKVMRHIAALTDEKVPKDGDFQFKDRAQALVNKWHTTIQSDKANGDAPAQMDVDKKEDAAPNGDAAHAETDMAAGDVSMAETHPGDLTAISDIA